jgi:hypothetical protein
MQVSNFETLVKDFLAIKKTKFDSVKRLVANFDHRKYLAKKKENFRKAKQLIENFKHNDVYKKFIKFDLFKILKLKLSENQISDIVAFVLNPQKTTYAKDILLDILKEAQQYASQEQSSIVKKLLIAVMNTNKDLIRVKREYHGSKSRIDIRIFSRFFVVDMEMKIDGGSETYIADEYQTRREYDDLKKFAEKNKIDNYIGLFVSPSGYCPASANFISLPLYKLSEIIANCINRKDRNFQNDLDKEIHFVLSHFFTSKYIF